MLKIVANCLMSDYNFQALVYTLCVCGCVCVYMCICECVRVCVVMHHKYIYLQGVHFQLLRI